MGERGGEGGGKQTNERERTMQKSAEGNKRRRERKTSGSGEQGVTTHDADVRAVAREPWRHLLGSLLRAMVFSDDGERLSKSSVTHLGPPFFLAAMAALFAFFAAAKSAYAMPLAGWGLKRFLPLPQGGHSQSLGRLLKSDPL